MPLYIELDEKEKLMKKELRKLEAKKLALYIISDKNEKFTSKKQKESFINKVLYK